MKENISKYRSKVIESFINIEGLIYFIISQHYFGYAKSSFIFEVLYDENFSFSLARNILQKILPNLPKNILEDMYRLNSIRNFFAHCNLEVYDNGDKPENASVLNPKNPKEKLDFEELYKEFKTKQAHVEKTLFESFTKLGGQSFPA